MIAIKKKDWIEIVLHIAFWIAVFYTLVLLTVPHIKMRLDHNGTIMEKDIRHVLSPGVFFTLGLLMVLFYGNAVWLLKKALHYKNILIRVILPLVWLAIILQANNYLQNQLPSHIERDDPVVNIVQQLPNKKQLTIRGFVSDSVTSIPGHLGHIQKDRNVRSIVLPDGGFSNMILFIFIIVFGLSIAYFFLKEWAGTEKFRAELEAVQLETELKFLKAQVNPHFLFNTLNNLFSMALKEGKGNLADRIAKLSNMMRYMLYESNDNVPLVKEIECLQDYLTLQGMRYAPSEINVSFQYPDPASIAGVQVAPMLFIPFLENAFKHGVAVGEQSYIIMKIGIITQKLVFNCENTNYSSVKKLGEKSGGIGLENVKRRLELIYPGRYELRAGPQNESYLVNLQIDLS
ncbi:sensor histidine kinase [Mucilaginibacter sp. SJ]|uniref:sensor histidine kinase n=1 Tax=Mucilaginibacter sp. SJ TaxID=3029053 RepID=UPI0023A983B1|nr:sensor histidine kinase [Mucilaginibacter sp. SJ]WEA01914.1 histidine kinase [Mucilaginibacter sp. SJ]